MNLILLCRKLCIKCPIVVLHHQLLVARLCNLLYTSIHYVVDEMLKLLI